ncbi:unnamed protein product [Polarella glacialis]|uniref:C3H1-type domain-containing protein n=1 Tax=Polarella glacialis TaxID=89957 RepID=A0A813KVS1_POLGL|nr:unnamed protein product [Polarella glacialis]
MFSSTCRFEETDETDLPFARSPETVAERLRVISSLNIEGSRLPHYYDTSDAMFPSTFSRSWESETDLPVAQSPQARAERRSFISSLNIEPPRTAAQASPGFEDAAPPAVKAPPTWSTEEPSWLPIAPLGVRFLTTWPPAWLPANTEEVQPQIITNRSLEESSVQRPSKRHDRGKCKPCAFFATDRGCHSGVDCLFCHLCQPGDEKALLEWRWKQRQRLCGGKESFKQRRQRQRGGGTHFFSRHPYRGWL